MNYLSRWLEKLASSKIFAQDRGAIAIMTALLLIVLMGFGALTIDVGYWYHQKRQLQFAADAGAVGGAIAKARNQNVTTYATYDLVLNNCTGANNCTVVAINNPPASGPNTSNLTAVEVILSKPASTFLSKVVLPVAPTIQSRSVVGGTPLNNCVIALSPTGNGLSISGNASLNSAQCGVYVNSSANNAASVVGGSSINTNFLNVVGGITGGGNITGSQSTGVSPLADPYIGLPINLPAGCNQTNFSVASGANGGTINPGVYCGGMDIKGTVNLAAGVYYLIEQGNKGGDFKANAQAVITGTGVTIILTHRLSNKPFGTVDISGGASINLSAPTTGTYTGVLFFGDRNTPSNFTESFVGGSNQVFSGALYFPSANIKVAGNSGGAGNPCLQLVASTITITGTSAVSTGCTPLDPGASTKLTFLE
jgi:Flp pilus assembly protein TadG